jgi:polar amino acid transport system ATP-binding protein
VNSIRDFHFTVHSADYDLYALETELRIFCNKYFLSEETIQCSIRLAEEILNHITLGEGDVLLSYRFAEKTGTLALEVLMPPDSEKVLPTLPEKVREEIDRYCTGTHEEAVKRNGTPYQMLKLFIRTDK